MIDVNRSVVCLPLSVMLLHCAQTVDSQIYVCTTVNEAPLAVQRFTACVSDISDWMSASRLKLNPMKTKVLWLGSSQLLSQISITEY